MAIVHLLQSDTCKYLVSQNCDGLHRKSGVHKDKISELHGNTNIERCSKCNKEYLRDFDASSNSNDARNHKTGRNCDDPQCRGILLDSIINFGENLPEVPLKRAFDHAKKSDLCIVMGSSCTVTPAADFPEKIGKRAKLVIVNLQKTPLDNLCALRIYAKCDQVSELLMSKLGMTIPPFLLHRRLHVQTDANKTVTVTSVDELGAPFKYIRELTVNKTDVRKKQPFLITNPTKNTSLNLTLAFYCHYGEPNLTFDHNLVPGTVLYKLTYNPMNGEWQVTIEKETNTAPATTIVPKEEQAKPVVPQPTSYDLHMGNKHTLLKDDAHAWTLFVQDDANIVEQVKFVLHPTFSPSEIIVKQAPFEISRQGWGTFECKAEVTFKKETKMAPRLLKHVLNFTQQLTKNKYVIE